MRFIPSQGRPSLNATTTRVLETEQLGAKREQMLQQVSICYLDFVRTHMSGKMHSYDPLASSLPCRQNGKRNVQCLNSLILSSETMHGTLRNTCKYTYVFESYLIDSDGSMAHLPQVHNLIWGI